MFSIVVEPYTRVSWLLIVLYGFPAIKEGLYDQFCLTILSLISTFFVKRFTTVNKSTPNISLCWNIGELVALLSKTLALQYIT